MGNIFKRKCYPYFSLVIFSFIFARDSRGTMLLVSDPLREKINLAKIRMPYWFEYKILWLMIIIGSLSACASNKNATRKITINNQYQNEYFNPSFYLYHNSETESTLYYNINPSELLFSRSNPDFPFESKIEFEILLFEINDNKKNVIDTITVQKTIVNQKDLPLITFGEISLPMLGDKNYFITVNSVDLNKNGGQRTEMLVPKSNVNHRMNFLVLDDSTNLPIYNYQKIGKGGVSIVNERNSDKKIRIYELELARLKFPPPPFASRQVFLPDLPDSTRETTYFKENYAYFLTTDEANDEGITIAVRNPYFPEVKTFQQMAMPTRYITTKSEYEELVSGIRTKKALDDFWIKCGGSTERGKQLIQVYYNRVAVANKYFSTIKSGYKTDRGAIFIVYGRPSQVLKRANSETWVYGDITNPNSLSFTFQKTDNIYSNNSYELQRNSGYRIHWQRAVTNWINGRVYERK